MHQQKSLTSRWGKLFNCVKLKYNTALSLLWTRIKQKRVFDLLIIVKHEILLALYSSMTKKWNLSRFLQMKRQSYVEVGLVFNVLHRVLQDQVNGLQFGSQLRGARMNAHHTVRLSVGKDCNRMLGVKNGGGGGVGEKWQRTCLLSSPPWPILEAMIKWLWHLPYETGQTHMRLFSLENELRGDMAEVH